MPAGACGADGCHDQNRGGLLFDENNSQAAHEALLAFQHPLFGAYVAPCAPQDSGLLCNLLVEDGVPTPNPVSDCGSKMPKVSALNSPVKAPLTQNHINTIVEWIECGAPFN